jgi:phosphoribosylformylglycinamidine cyclo-ligase
VNWNLPAPSEEMALMQKHGEVSDAEAYRTWNMGIGMILVVSPEEQEKTMQIIKEKGYEGLVVGSIA